MDRQNDRSDFIICPMLCYSNGTDNDHDHFTAYVGYCKVHLRSKNLLKLFLKITTLGGLTYWTSCCFSTMYPTIREHS